MLLIIDQRVNDCFFRRLHNRVENGSRRSFGMVSTDRVILSGFDASGFAVEKAMNRSPEPIPGNRAGAGEPE